MSIQPQSPAETIKTVSSFVFVHPGAVYAVESSEEESLWELGFVSEVHMATDEYLVYTGDEGLVHFVCEETGVEFGDFQGQFHEVQATPTPTIGEDERRHFRSILGQAMSAALEEDRNAATANLNRARAYASGQAERHARVHYLEGSILVTTASSALGAIGITTTWSSDLASVSALTLCFIGMAGGSIGGLLSVGRETVGPGKLDPAATKRQCQQAGAIRILYATITGMLLAAAFQVGLVKPAVFAQPIEQSGITLLLLVACAGGFLEKRATAALELLSPRS